MKEELMLEDVITLAHRAASEGRCWSNDIHLNGAVVTINGCEYDIRTKSSISPKAASLTVEQDDIKLFSKSYLSYSIFEEERLGYEEVEKLNSFFYAKASEEAERKKEEKERNLKPIRESAIRNLKKNLRI